MSTTKNTALFFALGATVGGITALLLAPDKGKVTRQRIRERSDGLRHRGTARQWTGAVGDAFAAAKETYEHEKNNV